MEHKELNITGELHDYILKSSLQEMDILQKLREETDAMRLPALMKTMLSSPEESQFIALLLKMTRAKKILEIGTFTGYTTLWMAMSIPSDGKIITCDISDRFAGIGERYWKEAGVLEKIDLKIGPALSTIDELLEHGQEGTFDFIFIDADKENYINYYEKALQLVRTGGIIGIDNVLRTGDITVIDPEYQEIIRQLNEFVHKDERVSISMLPIGDGLTLAVRCDCE